MGKYNEEYYKYLGENNSLMQEAIAGISVVKAFNLQDIFYAKCKKKLNKSLEIYNNKINVRGTLIMPIMFMIYEFPYVICAAYGGYLAIYENLSASGLVAFVLLLGFLVGPASNLPNLVVKARSAAGASRRLFELLTLKTERVNGSAFEKGKEKYDIEFENVCFGYEENKEVLKNLSFKVKRGNRIALVGYSGCGKSTILNLSGDLTSRLINDINSMEGAFNDELQIVGVSLIGGISSAIIMFSLDLRLSIITIVIGIISARFNVNFASSLRILGDKI